MTDVRILVGDAREVLATLPAESVQCVVTSPPYWGLRDYGATGQIGLELAPERYVAAIIDVFREVRRVLRKDGTVWLNLGDSFSAAPKGSLAGQDKSELTSVRTQLQSPVGVSKLSRVGRNPKQGQENSDLECAPHRSRPLQGIKPKDIIGIPWLVAFALREEGWYLRAPIVWAKPNGMPGSQKDRPTINYEFVFLLSKSRRYYYNDRAVRTPLAQSSIARLSQPTLDQQLGSERANGGAKSNGRVKAVKFGGNKFSDRDRASGAENCGNLGDYRERERERERAVQPRAHLQRQRMEGSLTPMVQLSARCGGFPPSRTRKRTSRSCRRNWHGVAFCSVARRAT